MAKADFVTEEMLELRLFGVARMIDLANLPVGLQPEAKRKTRGFCAIGLMGLPESDWQSGIWDVFVGLNGELKQEINEKLREACERVGVPFQSIEATNEEEAA